MKKIILIRILTLGVLLTGCSPKLSKFYINPESILFQHQVNYMPNCYNMGIMSKSYIGRLTIVEDELIFEPDRQAKVYGVALVSAFQIHKQQILNIELSDRKAFGKNIMTVQTFTKNHCFQMPLADGYKIYEMMSNWVDTNNNVNNVFLSEKEKQEKIEKEKEAEEVKPKSKGIGMAIGGTVGYRNLFGGDKIVHGVGANVFLDKIFFKHLKLSLNAGYDKYVYNLSKSEVRIGDDVPITFGIYYTDKETTLLSIYAGIEVGLLYSNIKNYYSVSYDGLMQPLGEGEFKDPIFYLVVGISHKLTESITLEANFKTVFLFQNKINIGIGYNF